MFGYTAEEAIGQSIRMIIPADRQSEEDMVLGADPRAARRSRHFETIRQRKDGTLIPISLTVSPILRRRRPRHRRLENRPRHQRPASRPTSPRAGSPRSSNRRTTRSSRKDLNSIITSWNRAAERMFGYTAAEAIGKSIRMIIPEDRQSEEDVVLAQIRAGEKVDHYETRPAAQGRHAVARSR